MQLGYVIRYVPDVARTLSFYEAAFGLSRRFLDESGTYGELETGATALAFAAESLVAGQGLAFERARPDSAASAHEVGLVTDDVAAAVERAVAAGAALVKPPERKPWGQIVAYVRDCDGALVEICTRVG